MTSKDMTNATSSPASADGPMPSTSPDGPLTDQYGPEAVPVSRFRALDSTRAMPTNDTSGPLFSALSPSAALSASLASRLQARMDVNGSPEYVLTWKHWDMPAGPLVYRLRASPRRTIEPVCIGWPTPVASDGHKNTRTHQGAMNEAERVGLRRSDLQTVVQVMMGDRLPFAGWPTPEAGAQNINDTTWQERQAKLRRKYNNGNGFGMTLGMAVRTAGWGTPQARDWKDVGDQSNIPVNGYLPRQVRLAGQPMLAGWTTPQAKEPNGTARPSRSATGRRTEYLGRQVRGPIANGSGAETDITGALNPQFSCWLMGYPQEWVSCADLVTP